MRPLRLALPCLNTISSPRDRAPSATAPPPATCLALLPRPLTLRTLKHTLDERQPPNLLLGMRFGPLTIAPLAFRFRADANTYDVFMGNYDLRGSTKSLIYPADKFLG